MKECEGDRFQRKSKAVKKECRTSGGQTDDRFKGKEKQFVFNSLFNRKPMKSVKDGSIPVYQWKFDSVRADFPHFKLTLITLMWSTRS